MRHWQGGLCYGVGALLLLALLYDTHRLPLRDYRETRLAEIAREMCVTGEWLVPHLNGSPFLDKPPLAPWLVGLSFATLGMSERSARLPGVFAVVWTAAVAGWMTHRLFGTGTGLLGAVLVLGAPGLQYYGRMLLLDTIAMALVLSAMAAFVEGYLRRHYGWYCLGFLACALGVMTRGPVGLVYPLGALVAFLLCQDRSAMKAVPWGTGALLVVVLTLPWFVWIGMHYENFLYVTFIRHHIDRLLPHHTHPFVALPRWQILCSFLGFVGPVSLWLPWVRRLQGVQGSQQMLWWLVGIVLGSVLLSTGRNHPYTLPAVPPLMILTAGWLGTVPTKRASSWYRTPALLLGLGSGMLFVSVLGMEAILDRLVPLLHQASTRVVMQVTLSGAAGMLFFSSLLLWQRRTVAAGIAVAAAMLPGTWMLVHVQQQMLPFESRAGLARVVAQHVPVTWPVLLANPDDHLFEGTGGWGFYTQRQVFMIAFEPPDPVVFQGAPRPEWILDMSAVQELWQSGRSIALLATPPAQSLLQRVVGHLPAPFASDGKFSLWLVSSAAAQP